MDTSTALRLLRLQDSAETTIDGVVWLRLGDEFKASPHGSAGDYDTESWFVDRKDVREIVKEGLSTKPQLFQDFVLLLQPISDNPKAVWYRSEEPIEWTEARDRILASGATEGYQIGGHGKGKFMISVDPHEVDRHRRAGRAPVLLSGG